MKMQNKPHQRLRRRPSPAGVALLLLLLCGVGLWLPWCSIVPVRLQDNVVDLLQIHGRWLGFLPIAFEPMPEWQHLTTPRNAWLLPVARYTHTRPTPVILPTIVGM